jgi:hypothetical protein
MLVPDCDITQDCLWDTRSRVLLLYQISLRVGTVLMARNCSGPQEQGTDSSQNESGPLPLWVLRYEFC